MCYPRPLGSRLTALFEITSTEPLQEFDSNEQRSKSSFRGMHRTSHPPVAKLFLHGRDARRVRSLSSCDVDVKPLFSLDRWLLAVSLAK